MNGRLKREGSGVVGVRLDLGNWGNWVRLDFHRSNAPRASLVRGTVMLRCPRAFERGASAPLEDSPGASRVAERGDRVGTRFWRFAVLGEV